MQVTGLLADWYLLRSARGQWLITANSDKIEDSINLLNNNSDAVMGCRIGAPNLTARSAMEYLPEPQLLPFGPPRGTALP
jgi:hypothetical protein